MPANKWMYWHTCGQSLMPGGTESASLGQWCWPRERASSGLATGRVPPVPWGDGRRQAPGTPSPTDTAESPEYGWRMFRGAGGYGVRNVLFLCWVTERHLTSIVISTESRNSRGQTKKKKDISTACSTSLRAEHTMPLQVFVISFTQVSTADQPFTPKKLGSTFKDISFFETHVFNTVF